MTLFGFKTIHAGEQALIRNHLGEAKVVNGPARVTLWRSKVEKLRLYYAGEGQFLEVNQRNGPRLCLTGPTQLYLNPIDHESIHIKDSILVSANEALVVYSAGNQGEERIYAKLGDEKENSFERKVLYGPIRYVPKPSEWIHEFCWHGEDPTNKTKKIKGALQFKLLRVIADQFYYNVPEVRTKDDTQITVKLMVFFELIDIVKMLDNTHDPIADFINAVCSDTIQYCSSLSYEEFVEKTSQMNELTTFKQLSSRALNIGYRINKVVFRGFHSSDALQNMHDKAIHERTRLRLEADTEDHRQRTLDLQLVKEEERSAKQRELEREKEDHKRSLEREEHTEKLRLDAAVEEHKQKQLDMQLMKEAERSARQRELEREQDEHRRQMEREAHKDKMVEEREMTEATINERRMAIDLGKEKVKIEKERLDGLKGLDVDVTQVLIAECRNPDKTLRLENADGATALHVHEEFGRSRE
eukprot:GFUD01037819.1.p1 GENE.GFUD01037819.1~~GFUD01037819.1.p1  ORF type:complete len:472 (+),score=167.86 GFUD01037819.1:62-1477(+)